MWKRAIVIPIYKRDKNDPVLNYRPISILSTFAKIFESLVCPCLQSYLKPYVRYLQHRFVRPRSKLIAVT